MRKLVLFVLIMASWALASAQECELRIKVRPTIATVTIDNQQRLVKGDGSLVVSLPMGEHEIVVSAEGFATTTKKVNLQTSKEQMNIYLELAPSSVTIVCGDPDAGVFLNGELIGNGNCTREVPPGEYVVEVRKDGFQSQKQSFEIKANETKEVSFASLEPLKSKKKKVKSNEPVNLKRKIGILLNYAYAVAPQQSFGASMCSVFNQWGSYLNVMFGGKPFSKGDVTCDENGLINYHGGLVLPKYTGETRSSTFSMTGGVIYRFSDKMAMYGGLGYGNRKLCWQFDNDLWAENSKYTYKGLSLDTGAMLFVGPVAISLGVQTISFNYMELKAGIGITF